MSAACRICVCVSRLTFMQFFSKNCLFFHLARIPLNICFCPCVKVRNEPKSPVITGKIDPWGFLFPLWHFRLLVAGKPAVHLSETYISRANLHKRQRKCPCYPEKTGIWARSFLPTKPVFVPGRGGSRRNMPQYKSGLENEDKNSLTP